MAIGVLVATRKEQQLKWQFAPKKARKQRFGLSGLRGRAKGKEPNAKKPAHPLLPPKSLPATHV